MVKIKFDGGNKVDLVFFWLPLTDLINALLSMAGSKCFPVDGTTESEARTIEFLLFLHSKIVCKGKWGHRRALISKQNGRLAPLVWNFAFLSIDWVTAILYLLSRDTLLFIFLRCEILSGTFFMKTLFSQNCGKRKFNFTVNIGIDFSFSRIFLLDI